MSVTDDDGLVRYSGECPKCGDELAIHADRERDTMWYIPCSRWVAVSADRQND